MSSSRNLFLCILLKWLNHSNYWLWAKLTKTDSLAFRGVDIFCCILVPIQLPYVYHRSSCNTVWQASLKYFLYSTWMILIPHSPLSLPHLYSLSFRLTSAHDLSDWFCSNSLSLSHLHLAVIFLQYHCSWGKMN